MTYLTVDKLGQQQRQFEDKVQINFLKFSVQILIFSSWRIAKGRGVTRTSGDAVSASEPARSKSASVYFVYNFIYCAKTMFCYSS